MRSRQAALTVLVSALLVAAFAPASLARPGTTAPSVFINIHVTISDTKVTLTPKYAPRGSDARFLVRNIGTKAHAFRIGSTKVGSGFQSGFTRIVQPKKHMVLLLFLNYRGVLPYSVDNARSGLKGGTFTVGSPCSLCIQD